MIECEHSTINARRPVNYEPVISLKDSWGGRARELWQTRFAEVVNPVNSAFLCTGIGEAPLDNTRVGVRMRYDGSLIPKYDNLHEHLGHVPELLFLLASPLSTAGVVGLRGLARTYKEQGVQKIIPIMTSLAHERQDHQFFDSDGKPILEVTTLKDIVEILKDGGYIDGGIIIQPHSLRSVELALRTGFPLLPIDAFKFLVEGAELRNIKNAFVIGPDKGRKDDARILASVLDCPMGSAIKTRDRINGGRPTVIVPGDVLQHIREIQANVIIVDDEIREGGTVGGLVKALDGFANSITVCTIKAIFACGEEKSAIDHLSHPLIRKIVITDAVKPLNDTKPLQGKLQTIELGPEISRLVAYLQQNLVPSGDETWLRDRSKTNTPLRLDLSVEEINS